MSTSRSTSPAETRSSGTAIRVEDVSKGYRLYHERNQTLKSTLMRRGRATYEEFQALQGVSLDIPSSCTFGLIGPNGSGKSTLLKCMARILQPDTGRITIDGKVSALLELGAGFHPELSGRDNIFLNGAILGLSKGELNRKFDDIVGFADLDRFIDQPVKNYSSGMYVRLGFSVAINVDPDVLLVDEVLAVGDERFQRRCEEKFADLRTSGKTIVIVSHGLETVRNLCDQVAWLEHGQVQRVGTPGHVIDSYVETSHDAREDADDDAASVRWGTGEARVERVELLDGQGLPASRVTTGAPMTIRVHYTAGQRIPSPVFGLGLTRIDGVHVTGPNTRDADEVPDSILGPGHVDLRIDRLLLLPGTYDLDASIYDYPCLSAFDYRRRVLRFDVEAGSPRESYGVVSLGGRWSLSPGESARTAGPVPVAGTR